MVKWGWTKKLLTMNHMEKHITKRNTASENITYMVDKNCFLCHHDKLHPLQLKRGNGFQKQCIDILKNSFNKTHTNTSLQREETIYQLIN